MIRFIAGRMFLVAFVVACIAAGTGSASAAVIYATTYDPNAFDSQDFGTLNTDTGVFTSLGVLNENSPIFAMGYASDGQFEGVSYAGEIYEINTTTAATTDLGHVMFFDAVGGESVGGTFFLTTDGTSALYTVVPPSTTPTTLGSLTDSSGAIWSAAGLVATSPTGTLYVATALHLYPNNVPDDELLSFNPTTRISTVIGDLDADLFAGIFLGNVLYGFTANNQIVTIDTSTGTTTPVANINIGDDAIGAVAPLSSAPVPEPGSLTMLAIGAVGALFTRRRWCL